MRIRKAVKIMWTKEEIGKIIKDSRISAELTQMQVAKAISRPQQTIASWEGGKSQPDADTLFELFKLFGKSVDEAFGFSQIPFNISAEEKNHIKKYRLLDLYGKEAVDSVLDVEHRRYLDAQARTAADGRSQMDAAAEFIYVVPQYLHPMSAGFGETLSGDEFEDMELRKKPPRGTSYIARVSGDSMEPTYHNGDLLFIRAQEEIMPGQIGVFFMDGRQWVKELGDGVLLSHNPEYEPRPMTEDIRCQGRVLGVCDESYFS